jgi:acyl carrier protein
MRVMNKKSIGENLRNILSEVLEIEDFNVEISMEHIQSWDSLKHIQLITSIEDFFDIEIQFEDAIEMISMESIIEKIQKYKQVSA